MVSKAWLFTFNHGTQSWNIGLVRNHLKDKTKSFLISVCSIISSVNLYCNLLKNDLNLTRKHSSKMCTARFFSSGGIGGPHLQGSDQPPLPACIPPPLACRPPPPACRSPGCKSLPPRIQTSSSPMQTPSPWIQTLSHVTCDACWEANPPPHVNKITDTCKSITLPQTSFAGGNKIVDTFSIRCGCTTKCLTG